MINIRYPVSYCHFCDQLMCYNRYENGDSFVYCNNSISSCMGFTYARKDDNVIVKDFSIAGTDIIYFRVFSQLQQDGTELLRTSLLLHDGDKYRRVEDLMKVTLDTILNKEESLKLLKTVNKQIMLLD